MKLLICLILGVTLFGEGYCGKKDKYDSFVIMNGGQVMHAGNGLGTPEIKCKKKYPCPMGMVCIKERCRQINGGFVPSGPMPMPPVMPKPPPIPAPGACFGQCINGLCAVGFTCNVNNMCCPASQQPATCPNGALSVGQCVTGLCPAGFTCNANNMCCPASQPPVPQSCPNGALSVGQCVTGLCPAGFTCNANNVCCPLSQPTGPNCPNGALNNGQCVNGVCQPGFSCNAETNVCCPACPNKVQPAGLCFPGNACGPGLTCTNNMCCLPGGGPLLPTTAVPPGAPTTAAPVQTTAGQANGPTTRPRPTCADGESPMGACFPDGSCGGEFDCENGLCCPIND